MQTWALAVLPLLGVVVGAVMQFWLGRSAARQRHLSELRAQSYVDYLRSVAAAGHLRSDEDLRDAHRSAADAKARVAIYGGAGTITALSRFEEKGANLGDDAAADAFIAVVSSMRSEGDPVPEGELRLLLLGPSRSGPRSGMQPRAGEAVGP